MQTMNVRDISKRTIDLLHADNVALITDTREVEEEIGNM